MTVVLIDEVRAWLLNRNAGVHDIALDEDLIDARLISSLTFMEFLLFLEELAGRELELNERTAVSFRTLRGLRDRVLPEVRR